MPSITGRAYLTIVKQSAKTLGVPLPTEVNEVVAKADDLVAKAEAITGSKLNSAVLDAIAEGRDYYGDKAIPALMLDHLLVTQNIGNAARERGNALLEAALVEHADTILTDWADALEPHSTALAAAAEALPSADLDNLNAVKAAGAEAMHHWANAQHAIKLWGAAVDGFKMIADAARITVGDKVRVITADAAAGLAPDPWTLARHGVPLSLPTLGGYMERVATRQAHVTVLDVEDQVDDKQPRTAALR